MPIIAIPDWFSLLPGGVEVDLEVNDPREDAIDLKVAGPMGTPSGTMAFRRVSDLRGDHSGPPVLVVQLAAIRAAHLSR